MGAYVGSDGVDYWARERWYEEFEKHHVFVMTAQILLDVLQHHFFELISSNLLIFDECHSVVKDHPMRSVTSPELYDANEIMIKKTGQQSFPMRFQKDRYGLPV